MTDLAFANLQQKADLFVNHAISAHLASGDRRMTCNLMSVRLATKSAVSPATLSDDNVAAWGTSLFQTVPRVASRLVGALRLGVNVSVRLAIGTVTAQWRGQARPKPLSALAFAAPNLPPRKLVVTFALSREAVRAPGPEGVALTRSVATGAITEGHDAVFLGDAAGDEHAPAGILFNVSPTTATGDGPLADCGAALAALTRPTRPHLVMDWATAAACGAGLVALRDLGVGMNVSPSAAGRIIAIDAARVLLAESDDLIIEFSEHATAELDDTPSGGAQSLTSFWQSNLVGGRVELFSNWHAAAGSVAFIAASES